MMSASAPAPTSGASSVYPDLTSPTDSVIEGEFGAMSAEEQEKQREEWKQELAKTEEEIATLRYLERLIAALITIAHHCFRGCSVD